MEAGHSAAQHPFTREGLGMRVLPFAVGTALAFALLPLSYHDGDLALAAGLLAAAIAVAIAYAPWERLPPASAVLPPLAYLIVIALLREASGRPTGGYAALVMLPALWVALHDRRSHLGAVLGGIVLLFVVPELIDPSGEHSSGEWRRAVLWTTIAGFVGISTQRLVADLRTGARELAGALERLRESEAHLLAIINSADEGVIVLDRAGRVTLANPSAEAMLGYSQEELRAGSLHELTHHTRAGGAPYPATECPIAPGAHTPGEHRRVDDEVFWRKDGTSFPVSYACTAITGDGEGGVVLTFSDITQRREIDRMKNEFVSVVGHELRTPLTAIRGSLGLIAGGVFGELPGESRRMLEIAISNTDRLVRLINDILDIERIEAGKIAMAREMCDAARIMRQAEELMAPAASSAGVSLQVAPESARIWADPDRVLQALTNLIGNAVKFSPEGGTVAVDARGSDGELLISVRDEGRGIPADQLERIFDRFAQVDASDSREKGGTGLGLAISRTIVHRHGGRIWAESRPGEGATFTIALPLAGTKARPGHRPLALLCDLDDEQREATARLLERWGYVVAATCSVEEALAEAEREPPIVVLIGLVPPETAPWDLVERLREGEATREIPVIALSEMPVEGDGGVQWLDRPPDERSLARALDRARGSDRPLRALVVEDDTDLAAVVVAILEGHGAEAEHAASVAEAIEAIERLPPDMLVLDLILPERDGAEVVDWLRSQPGVAPMPIVVYTARDLGPEDRERLTLDADTQLLTKARVPPEEFERRVMGLLDRLSARRNGGG
jgi:PAS domain S-box-containing protein